MVILAASFLSDKYAKKDPINNIAIDANIFLHEIFQLNGFRNPIPITTGCKK